VLCTVGKTFVGVQMAKAFYGALTSDARPSQNMLYDFIHFEDDYENMPSFRMAQSVSSSLSSRPRPYRILCLCYTNHALDSFLEALMDAGINKEYVVRLGNSPKMSDRLKERCIKDADKIPFSQHQTRRFAMLKSTQRELSNEKSNLKDRILDKRPWTKGSFVFVKQYLSGAHPDVLPEFGCATKNVFDRFFELLSAVDNDNDAFESVGRGGKTVKEDDLFQDWLAGRPRPPSIAQKENSIWDLSKTERYQLLTKWKSESEDNNVFNERLASRMSALKSINDELETLRSETKVAVLSSARVIGCTTTSAAMNSSLLQQAAPDIIIIEEAAEILEAHVLTNLFRSVKRVIMIGDHLQLRPKLESYTLRKESGQGIDFDMSLFERLVVENNFPYLTLNVQHRMRPEISNLVRLTTYPTLEDHPSVRGRDDVRGIASNVVFITHSHFESNDEERAVLGINSKVNLFEVDMLVSIAKYFLQQMYSPCDIVILTPYLGQLMQIQCALADSRIAVDVSDLDRSEIARHSLSLQTESAEAKATIDSSAVRRSSIRVATIDNFQGEESKIIIGSLVRSNEDGDIGFLSGAERVNVFFSRARDGFIIVGNASCLSNARNPKGSRLWKSVLKQLNDTKAIFTGFPTRCAHGPADELPKSSEDFARLCRDGGCNRPCNQIIKTCPLNHTCPLRCHPYDVSNDIHDHMQCEVIVFETCRRGHPVSRVCHRSEASPCHVMIESYCPFGHINFYKCCDKEPTECDVCNSLEKMREKAALKAMNDSLALRRKLLAAEEAKLEVKQRLASMLAESEADQKLAAIESEKELMLSKIAQVKKSTKQQQKKKESRGKCKDSEQFLVAVAAPAPVDQNIDADREDATSHGDIGSCLEKALESSLIKEIMETMKEIMGTMKEEDIQDDEVDSSSIDESDDETSEVAETPSQCCFDPARSPNVGAAPVHRKVSSNQHPTADLSIIFKAITDGNNMKAYELAMAEIVHHEEDDVNWVILSYLLIIVRFKFGENAVELSRSVKVINLKQANMSIRAISLSYFVTAILEHALKSSPYTAADCASKYLDISTRHDELKDFPQSWKDEAKAIRATTESSSSLEMLEVAKVKQLTMSEKWKAIKERNAPAVIDELMDMIGLEQVKNVFVEQYQRLMIAKEQRMSLSASSYNCRFDGNPGTG
jgi:hypothetical protein